MDPDDKHQSWKGSDPGKELDEDAHNPRNVTVDFSMEEHHFQKRVTHLAETQALPGKRITVRSNKHQLFTWLVATQDMKRVDGKDVGAWEKKCFWF